MSDIQTDLPTDQTTSSTLPRLFIFNEQHFEDPGAEWTNEQMRDHLATYFPEIAGGLIETAEKEGILEITFSKRVTTKGSEAIWQALALVVPEEKTDIPDLIASLKAVAEKPRTVFELAENAQAHWELIEAIDAFNTSPNQLIRRCLSLPSHPAPLTPIGF